ncbi:unnamed protein product [Moneuplotes crassus]|uniref:Protein kinase domain-containing protein n=2 Tax=Euplotes crassus TaxID=5936 RepID=A0AAD1U7E5_EUPCR|nr:unnamed protein product [Moneuplotes crassus]
MEVIEVNQLKTTEKEEINMDGEKKKSYKNHFCEGENREIHHTYQPCDPSEMEDYKTIKVIYQMPLAPCKVETVADSNTGNVYAKKTVFKEGLNDLMKALARQECVIQSELDHPNIIKLHKYCETEKHFELVMDYCNNGSYFEDRLEESNEPIEDMELLKKYAKEILCALVHIHSKGILHCDIKLSNMGLHKDSEDSEEILKLFDFNLSVYIDSEIEGKAHLEKSVGTFGYMAPELTGKDIHVGPEIDMWALGICLYKMCVAYPPNQVRGYEYGTGPIPFVKRDWRKIDPDFQDLIKQMLEYNPENRISSAEALEHKALS